MRATAVARGLHETASGKLPRQRPEWWCGRTPVTPLRRSVAAARRCGDHIPNRGFAMLARIYRITKRLLLLLLLVAAAFFAGRVYLTQRGPALAIWHTYVPHEMKAAELDRAGWKEFQAAEARIFE